MTAIQAVLTLAMLAVALYGVYEFRRWGTPAGEIIGPRQRAIRRWGFFFLLLSLSLWFYGTTLPLPHNRLALAHYLAYWILTALAIVPLVPLALLDWRENIRRLLAERERLRREMLEMPPKPGSEVR